MKQPLLAALSASILCVAIAGCGRQEPQPPATQAGTPVATQSSQPTPRVRARGKLSAEEIAQIKAGGKTGLWADPGAACATGPRESAVLTWNVSASGASKVVVYIVGKNGKERSFGKGGAIGRRATGPWLRPGTTLRIRNAGDKSELGSVTIGTRQC